MLKKNTRKRLLAGALATVMMLTMCPSWALADDEDIATTQPLVDENRPVVDSAPVEADTTETPAVPTPSEPEATPDKDQNTAPAPSEGGANGDTDSTETGNDNASSDVSEDSKNNSQNNDVVSNAPVIESASQDAPSNGAKAVDVKLWYDTFGVKEINAESWVTNRHAADSDGNWTTPINSTVNSTIGTDDGTAVTTLAQDTFTDGNDETYVFWQARVLPNGEHQTDELNGDRTKDGTEIDSIRYVEDMVLGNHLEYHIKNKNKKPWKAFGKNDQLVFYYLVRTDYSQMVQIDVSDWTVDEEPSYEDRRSVTYQIIVKGDDGQETFLPAKKFWYNKTFTVSSVRVRETDSDHYIIKRVELDPDGLGTVEPVDKDGRTEYQFSLNLANADDNNNATVNIYVTPTVTPKQLKYELNGGTIKEGCKYTAAGPVYPDDDVIAPEVEKKDHTFDGWYTDAEFNHEWTGGTMPNDNLTLHAKWIDNNTTVDPETKTPAKYFVLLPTRTTPTSSASQGWASYLPNDGSDGGVKGLTHDTGYKGSLKPEGQRMADEHRTGDDSNGIYNVNGFGDDYLVPPTDLGFFTESNWSPDGTIYNSDKESNTTNPFSVLGTNFNVKNNISVVWYTIKYQADEGSYHVDGYVTGVPVTVTYHSNDRAISGTAEKTSVVDATSGDTYTVLDHSNNMFTAPNGYTFGGWYTEPDYTKGKKVAVGSTETLRTDWHLYAHWVPIKYNVTYKVGGDVDGNDYDSTGVYDCNSDVVIRPVPTKDGYTFHGWTPADDVANIIKIDDKGHFTMPAQNVLFNGTFAINHYTVTYKVGTEVVGTDVYDFNSDVVIRDVPTKEGYTFSGWKIGNADAENFKMPAHDVTIEGTFAINRYTVTYKVDTEVVGTDVYDFNSDVVIRDVPTKEGYTFSGWKIGTADAENFKMPAHDVTIEGTFAKNSSGGSGGHHRKPTVTIPDKVPTGLNGDDHYAYIVGYPDKTVRPQNGITRAEVATIFFRLLTDETRNANSTKSNSYSDVAAGAWYNHAVSTLSAMGIVKGDSNGKFNPNAPITRAEFAAIAARFDDKANSMTADFSDIVSHWAKNEISAASNNGWINGYPDGTFRPDNKITRAEAMTLVNRVLKRLPETAEDLHDDMIKWSDNSDASQWFYLAVQEATNSHYYQTKENKFEKWSELRDTRDWTELEK